MGIRSLAGVWHFWGIWKTFWEERPLDWNDDLEFLKYVFKLNGFGFNPYIDKKIVNKQIWHRVRIGKNLSYNECIQMKNKLKRKGIKNVWIDKNQSK